MSQSSYVYDENAETWPYFALTVLLVPLVPATVSYVASTVSRKQSDSDSPSQLEFKPYNSEALIKYKTKKSKNKVFNKKLLFIVIGWLLTAYVIFKIKTGTIIADPNAFDPYEIMGVAASATEKEIKSKYRKLSLVFHPDKLAKEMSEDDKADMETKFVRINKAYKALTDEVTRANYLKYGHPDGPQAVSHGIALPQILIEGKLSPVLVVVYVFVIGVLLPYYVGKWWSGVKSYTRQGLHVDTAATFLETLINYNPSVITKVDDVLEWISTAKEYELQHPDLLPEDIYSLLQAHINREPVKDELLKIEVIAVAPKLLMGLIDIASGFRHTEICTKAIETHRALVQAINPVNTTQQAILQLPNVERSKIDSSSPVHTLGKLFTLPKEKCAQFLGIDATSDTFKETLAVASRIPTLKVLSAEFKVPGETIIPPNSNSHISLKLLVKSPSNKGECALDESLLQDDLSMEHLRDPLKVMNEQPLLRNPTAPFFPEGEFQYENNGWVALLVLQRDNKLGEIPQKVTRLDTSNVNLSQEAYKDGRDAIVNSFKMTVLAPTPKEVGRYHFRLMLRSLVYYGVDVDIPLVMEVVDPPIEEVVEDNYGLEAPDEDSLAGAMAQLRGEKVKKVFDEEDDESDYDEDEDFSDINTDTEDEEE
ncbi:unnamed protein product [Kuraishia capsulata CBS 1993]|uniref:J domain-containing protein n=1 Tax=Kuraishia capsulata CBS 1993 TaxID=1382522 RepID=W6MMD1_9ASCO|nr:uncharacterized protein KUCA_T00003336001 [Kuraishia capsulata CBS 1993]CDK27358.1 unnamed protein product [Kuraishia capsulata CBS 1993]